MFDKVKVPVLGVIENMSTFVCPHCDKPTDIFSKGGGRKAAEEVKAPFLGEVPLWPEIRVSSDQGKPFVLSHADSPAAQAVIEITKKVVDQAAQKKSQQSSAWKV